MSELTLEGLHGITDTALKDSILEEFQSILLHYTSIKDLIDNLPDAHCTACNASFVEKVMSAMFAYKISKIKDAYGFSESIDKDAAKKEWEDALKNSSDNTNAIAEAQNIYHSFFDTRAVNEIQHVCFSEYINDTSNNWKQMYADYLKTNEFIMVLLGKIKISYKEFWEYVNLCLYKLARLENNEPPNDKWNLTAVKSVVECWEKAEVTLPDGFKWDELTDLSWLFRQQFTLVSGNFMLDSDTDSFANLLESNIKRWQAGYRIKTESSYCAGYASDVQLEIHGEPILQWLQSSGKDYFAHPDKVYNESRHSL